MRRLTRVHGLLLALGLCASPLATAQETEGSPASLIERALSLAEDSEGVFSAVDAIALHQQSGLKCPAYVGNAFLLQIFVFDSPAGRGLDVGCDYARRKAPQVNSAAAKHTVYAVKLTAGMTLDDVFAKYQAEMHDSSPPNARSGGEALHMKNVIDGFPEFRSEELFYTSGDEKWQTAVLVTILNGWIIEVRSTRASQYAVSSGDEANDQFVGLRLFFGAIAALGGPDFQPEFRSAPTQQTDPANKL